MSLSQKAVSKKVVVVGGGFEGTEAARAEANKKLLAELKGIVPEVAALEMPRNGGERRKIVDAYSCKLYDF